MLFATATVGKMPLTFLTASSSLSIAITSAPFPTNSSTMEIPNCPNPITANEVSDMFKDAFKDIFEGIFKAELDDTLGYSKYDYSNSTGENYRNGTYKKTLKSDIAGEFDVSIPRDRNNEYEPKIVKNIKRIFHL